MLRYILAALACCLPAALGFTIDGTVELRGNKAQRADVRVLLDGGAQVAFLDAENNFSFKDVSEGWHLVEVSNPAHVYHTARVWVSKEQVKARIANFLGRPDRGIEVNYPLHLRPTSEIHYFKEREKWSPLDLVKNPMILMLLFTGAMGFGLPKMMENMDPEMVEEMKEIQSGKKSFADLLKDEPEEPKRAIKDKESGKKKKN
eukprot:comp7918_c0_seq1/m.3478 comp7918_c0_seq1/g.3478  ORF comp7918_c0_seq1/g.3478 comp7918_c0_seq1/m.3478 type:complete len:203 (-) comp7918_c0_seq1:291-899(-)